MTYPKYKRGDLVRVTQGFYEHSFKENNANLTGPMILFDVDTILEIQDEWKHGFSYIGENYLYFAWAPTLNLFTVVSVVTVEKL